MKSVLSAPALHRTYFLVRRAAPRRVRGAAVRRPRLIVLVCCSSSTHLLHVFTVNKKIHYGKELTINYMWDIVKTFVKRLLA